MDNPFSIREDRISKPFLSRDKRISWTEGMFEENGDQKIKIDRPEAAFLGLSISPGRLKLFGIILVFFILILIGRSFYLQIIEGRYYHDLAEGNRIKIITVKAKRGVVFDRNGKQLVKNIPSYNLLLIPAELPKEKDRMENVLERTAGLAGVSIDEIKEKIDANKKYPYQPIVLRQGIDYGQIIQFTINQFDLPGVLLEEGAQRQYLLSDGDKKTISLSHVFGYTGFLTQEEYEEKRSHDYFLNDSIGKTGLELVNEKELRGNNGKKQVEVDARGREVQTITENSAKAGRDLTLNIDYELQAKAEEALQSILTQYNKKRGAVVALDPRNGKVLALVSLPAYNANDFAAGISSAKYAELLADQNKPIFNRVVSGVYPSGSTIKPVMATAALSENIITANTSFNSTGGISIGQWFFPDWKAGGHGITNVYKAIAESVNTFFYMIGGGFPTGGNPTAGYEFNGLGPEKIAEWLEKFGLGKKSGIDSNNEADGFVPTVQWKNETAKEQWYLGDTYNLSIGQGNLLVTPIQVANWTAIIANGGTMYQPQIVGSIGEENISPLVVSSNIAPAQNLAIVRQGMREAVLAGSARSFAELPIKVAAKTGTAQWNSNKANHAWFTCFAPYRDPQIVITVLVEEGEEGSRTAAAVARELMRFYATDFQK
ncbi:MAG: penicillin-binding protein 2 [Patescibacteria group bacterium]|jgi:penicillin-binding protein 2